MQQTTFLQRLRARPAAVWAVGHFLLLMLTRVVTGFNGLYGQDSHAYLAHSRALHAWLVGGPAPGDFFWPEGYPFLGSLLSFLGDPIWMLQLLSMASAAIGVYFFARLLQLIYPQARQHGLWAFVLVGLAPMLFRGGLLIMAESQCLALIIAACYFLLRYRMTTHKSAMFWAALCIGGAVVTRYPAALLLGLPTAWLGWMAIQRRDAKGLALLLGGLLLMLVPQFVFGNNHSGGLADHHFLANWSVKNFFRRQFLMEDGLMQYRFSNIAYVFGSYAHPFLVGLAGLVGLILLIRAESLSWGRWAQAPVVVYILFIGGIPFQNTRFLMLPLPFVMLLIYGSLMAGKPFPNWIEKWKTAAALGFAVLNLLLGFYLVRQFSRQSTLEKEIVEVVKSYPPTTLYSFGMNQAVETYAPKIPTVSLWEEKLDTTSSGEHVLFNTEKFAKQWEGKMPMQNWEFLQKNYYLLEIHSFEGGWKLYEIR